MLLLVAMTTRSTRVALKLWNRRETCTSHQQSIFLPCACGCSSCGWAFVSSFLFIGDAVMASTFNQHVFNFFILARHCMGRSACFYDTYLFPLLSLGENVLDILSIIYVRHYIRDYVNFKSDGCSDSYSGLLV